MLTAGAAVFKCLHPFNVLFVRFILALACCLNTFTVCFTMADPLCFLGVPAGTAVPCSSHACPILIWH